MKLQEAIASMCLGNKVKLPEWTGHWYIPEDKQGDAEDAVKNIKVLAKNGDIYDTPWLDKYADRDDFHVTRGELGFDFAVLAMNNEKNVRRKSWTTLRFVTSRKVEFEAFNNLPNVSHTRTYLKVGNDNSVELGWRPSAADMLATDWELAE